MNCAYLYAYCFTTCISMHLWSVRNNNNNRFTIWSSQSVSYFYVVLCTVYIKLHYCRIIVLYCVWLSSKISHYRRRLGMHHCDSFYSNRVFAKIIISFVSWSPVLLWGKHANHCAYSWITSVWWNWACWVYTVVWYCVSAFWKIATPSCCLL